VTLWQLSGDFGFFDFNFLRLQKALPRWALARAAGADNEG
jgi:hypothetical protein